MIEEKREALSAMLDDELPGRVFDQLVTDLGQDVELRKAISRYRLIGDVMRGDGVAASPSDIAEAVRERLNDEPAILAPQPRRALTRWGRGVAGAAIAASVALVAVGMLSQQEFTVSDVTQAPNRMASVPRSPVDPSDLMRGQARVPTLPQNKGQDDKRLTRYLAEHNEFASREGANGFMAYATFVAYDGR